MRTEKMIYIRKRQTRLAIKLEDILYLEKFKRQIIVHTAEGDDIRVYGKFDVLTPMRTRTKATLSICSMLSGSETMR